MHAAAQTPDTQNGSEDLQSALDVHVSVALGWQAPLVHVNPVAHGATFEQPGTHCPSSQTAPAAHSFEYLQTLVAAWHEPATH